MYGNGWETFRISGSGRETLPDVLGVVVGLYEYPGGVERPSRMSGSGRKTLQDVRKWSKDPP